MALAFNCEIVFLLWLTKKHWFVSAKLVWCKTQTRDELKRLTPHFILAYSWACLSALGFGEKS